MLHRSYPFLALSAALAVAADAPAPDPLDTIRAGAYSHASSPLRNARLLNWNIDRGKHLDGILATIHESRPDLCIFQEVDLGARRTQGMDVAQELAKETGM